jgi:hypothetical protein
MKKTTAYSGLILLFVTGVGLGIVGHSVWMKERFRRVEKRGPHFLQGNKMQNMTERLNLSAEQRDQIAAIIKTASEKSKTARDKHYAENNKQRRATILAIQTVLDKEQLEEFKKIIKADPMRREGLREGGRPNGPNMQAGPRQQKRGPDLEGD